MSPQPSVGSGVFTPEATEALNLPIGALVEIHWVDSVAEHGWSYRQDALDKATSEAMKCKSVGYVLKTGEDFILICSGVQQDHSVFATMQIPIVVVTEIVPLLKSFI